MNEMTAVGYRVFIGFLSVWPAIDGTFQAADFESIANEKGPFFFSTWSLMWHSILFPIRAPDVPGRRLCKVDGISASLSFQQLLLLLLRQMFRSTPIFHGDVASLIVWFVFFCLSENGRSLISARNLFFCCCFHISFPFFFVYSKEPARLAGLAVRPVLICVSLAFVFCLAVDGRATWTFFFIVCASAIGRRLVTRRLPSCVLVSWVRVAWIFFRYFFRFFFNFLFYDPRTAFCLAHRRTAILGM